MGREPAFILFLPKDSHMTPSPIARAQQDWRNGLSSDENPYTPGTPEHRDYAWEHHKLVHEEFVQDCLTKPEKQGTTHEKVAYCHAGTDVLIARTG